jgi:hypothetical protein
MDHQLVSENDAMDKTHSIDGVLHHGFVLLSFLRILLFPFAFVILVKGRVGTNLAKRSRGQQDSLVSEMAYPLLHHGPRGVLRNPPTSHLPDVAPSLSSPGIAH